MTARSAATRPRVLFRAPAGARLGFGHLVRCVRLAAALGVPCALALRARPAVGQVARALGATVIAATPRLVGSGAWDAVVVDDPSPRHAAPWLAAARRHRVLSVSIHDLGLGARGADIVIDGSLGAPHRELGGMLHAGPRFAILGGRARLGRRRRPRRRPTVLVGLGGGARASLALRVAVAIRRRLPAVRLRVALGLSRVTAARGGRLAAARVETVEPRLFGDALAEADVAVLAGGVSLYEAAAAGTPAVAVAVVDAQRVTTRAFQRAGIARDGGRLRTGDGAVRIGQVAGHVCALLEQDARLRAMSRAARRLVDGRGADRVASLILAALRPDGARPARRL